jgi:hypothetical protein
MRTSIAIFVTLLAIYLANGRAHPEVDCLAAPYEAWSLARHGSLDLRDYPRFGFLLGYHVLECPDGTWASRRPPGTALTALPVIAPLALLRDAPPRETSMDQLGKVAAAMMVAAAGVLFFLTCRGVAPAGAWPALILFGLGTCLWSVASQALWMHGPATLWLCVALYLQTHPCAERRVVSAGAGFALALAVLARPTAALFGAATGVALLVQKRWLAAACLALGAAVPLGFLCVLNMIRFGSPLMGGYAVDNWQETPPLWLGLGGLLVAPSRGMLVYSPALLLIPLGMRMLGRGEQLHSHVRGLLIAWLAAAGATVLFYARWYEWRGGWCYGPRFLCETMPILCLFFALAYAGLRAAWQRCSAWGLVALSVAVHFVGVFGYSGYQEWQRRHALADQGRCLFALHDTQIEAHFRAVVGNLAGSLKPTP